MAGREVAEIEHTCRLFLQTGCMFLTLCASCASGSCSCFCSCSSGSVEFDGRDGGTRCARPHLQP